MQFSGATYGVGKWPLRVGKSIVLETVVKLSLMIYPNC